MSMHVLNWEIFVVVRYLIWHFGIHWSECVVPQSKGSVDISHIHRMDNLRRTNLERDKITKCQSWAKIFFQRRRWISLSSTLHIWSNGGKKWIVFFPSYKCIFWIKNWILLFPFLQIYLLNQQHLHLCHTFAGLTFTLNWLHNKLFKLNYFIHWTNGKHVNEMSNYF